MLVSVGMAMTCAEKLMDSEDMNVRVFALKFTKLVEMEITLMNAMGVKGRSEGSNTLARRARLGR